MSHSINMALAKSFGLDTARLMSFTLLVRAGQEPVIEARYAVDPLHVVNDGIASVVRKLKLVEMVATP